MIFSIHPLKTVGGSEGIKHNSANLHSVFAPVGEK